MGMLCVIGESPALRSMMQGGFELRTPFAPARLYELAKMDGAIILSDDLETICWANVQLEPDHRTPSSETGIRHRTAERVARRSEHVVLAVSQRRRRVTVYRKAERYVLQDLGYLLSKANQALQTLEKYRLVADAAIARLDGLELQDEVILDDVAGTLTAIETVLRLAREVQEYMIELGQEGRLLRLQLEQLTDGLSETETWVLRDYRRDSVAGADLCGEVRKLTPNELSDLRRLGDLLGLSAEGHEGETHMRPRGYRLLHRMPRLTDQLIENVVTHFGTLQNVMAADTIALDAVTGIGQSRAGAIQRGLNTLRRQVLSRFQP